MKNRIFGCIAYIAFVFKHILIGLPIIDDNQKYEFTPRGWRKIRGIK